MLDTVDSLLTVMDYANDANEERWMRSINHQGSNHTNASFNESMRVTGIIEREDDGVCDDRYKSGSFCARTPIL